MLYIVYKCCAGLMKHVQTTHLVHRHVIMQTSLLSIYDKPHLWGTVYKTSDILPSFLS